MKFKFQCSEIKTHWNIATLICLQLLMAAFDLQQQSWVIVTDLAFYRSLLILHLERWFLKCGTQASSISITREKDANSWAPSQTMDSEIRG